MPASQQALDEVFQTHLPYEVEMLRYAYDRLEGEITDDALRNALIECFCLHARSLIEFFEKKGDVSAKAFANGNYVALVGKAQLVSAARRDLNNQISHLVNDQRTTSPAHKISADLRRDYLNLIEAELAHLGQHLLPPRKQSWSTLTQMVRIVAGPPAATNDIIQSSTTFPSSSTVSISTGTPKKPK